MVEEKSKNLEPLVAMIIIFVLSIAIIPLSAVLVNKEGLKALIEAEATILGFFGVIIVYMLTLDARIDRLEQQRFEWDKEHKEKEATNAKNLRDNVQELKKSFIKRSVLIGAMLAGSMLICMWLLGIVDIIIEMIQVDSENMFVKIASFSGALALLMFLESAWLLFDLFKDVAKAS